jgi:ribosome maturation protein SDO1
MVSLDQAVIARLKASGATFEILVDPDKALSFRRGEPVDVASLLATEEVFADASRGDRPAEEALKKAFETTDILQIAQRILKDGELQLTAEQRRKLVEDKRRQVVTLIARNAINPQTMAPHPPARIEKAMEEGKVHIDPMKSVDENVKEAMKAIRPIIPIRFEEVQVAVRIPSLYAAKAYGDVAAFGEITKQEWQNDGSWICVIKMPAGMQTDFYDALNRKTKGEAQTKILKKSG